RGGDRREIGHGCLRLLVYRGFRYRDMQAGTQAEGRPARKERATGLAGGSRRTELRRSSRASGCQVEGTGLDRSEASPWACFGFVWQVPPSCRPMPPSAACRQRANDSKPLGETVARMGFDGGNAQ